MFRVTRRYGFAASHRLHAGQLSEEENQALYGKCNNPYGHGHNYLVEVSVRGPVDERSGCVVAVPVLDALVARAVTGPLDRRNLNEEVAAFASAVPTSENLAMEICRRLKQGWGEAFPEKWPALEKIRIAETERNIFEVNADEIE